MPREKKRLYLQNGIAVSLQKNSITDRRMTTAKDIIREMETMRNEAQREVLMRFFKTGQGQYGEGDRFLGIKVPDTRTIVRQAKDLHLHEIPELLQSPWHEVRLCGLLIMVSQFESATRKRVLEAEGPTLLRDEIVTLYLKHAGQANNWDLVDLSAPKILGHWLTLPTFLERGKMETLDGLARSSCLWRQRISMVSTWKPTQEGDPSWCLRYAGMHLGHRHDLMHKAVGWMLREMGKRVSMDLLRDFLRQHLHEMSRTTLRYAIEKMSEKERRQWMSG